MLISVQQKQAEMKEAITINVQLSVITAKGTHKSSIYCQQWVGERYFRDTKADGRCWLRIRKHC